MCIGVVIQRSYLPLQNEVNMDLLHFLALGTFLLIMLYLGLGNPNGVSTVFGTGFTGINNTIKTLQGR